VNVLALLGLLRENFLARENSWKRASSAPLPV